MYILMYIFVSNCLLVIHLIVLYSIRVIYVLSLNSGYRTIV